MLDPLRERPDRAGILLDFDGSLSPIVARPEQAAPVAGATEVLAALVERFQLVAVVSGRASAELIERIGVPGLVYEGLYGLEDAASELTHAIRPRVDSAAGIVPEAWVEDKGVSLAVHYRQAPDPTAARRTLVAMLDPVAIEGGMELIEGKMVLELVPPDRPMKGGVVERLVGTAALDAVLFAGDDVADIDAFAALGRLTAGGLHVVRVAVLGLETPPELAAAADLRVEGPAGLVELLRTLV
ncbi:MAG: trehalose-phosphatase [Actinomycetota bacterium]